MRGSPKADSRARASNVRVVVAAIAVFCAGASMLVAERSAAAEEAAPVTLSASESAPSASPSADRPTELAPIEAPQAAHPSNYEIGFVSVGAYQSWAIAGRWLFVGLGGALGPPLYRYSKLGSNKAGWDPDLEIASANAFLRVTPAAFLDIDLGPRIALGSALFNVKDPPQNMFAYGAYADLRFGSKNIKLGPRFEYDHVAYANYAESGWRLTPLMLRVYR